MMLDFIKSVNDFPQLNSNELDLMASIISRILIKGINCKLFEFLRKTNLPATPAYINYVTSSIHQIGGSFFCHVVSWYPLFIPFVHNNSLLFICCLASTLPQFIYLLITALLMDLQYLQLDKDIRCPLDSARYLQLRIINIHCVRNSFHFYS